MTLYSNDIVYYTVFGVIPRESIDLCHLPSTILISSSVNPYSL